MVIKVGDVFSVKRGSDAVVKKYENSKNVIIYFIGYDEYEYNVMSSDLIKGNIKNPYHRSVFSTGYMGVGIYNTTNSSAYKTWNNMLKRCYSYEYIKKHPTYKDCLVCDEWLNYQNFAKWYSENKYSIEGYHLDKDILLSGNKIYSPETCVFIPKEINLLLYNGRCNSSGAYPVGVSINSFNGRYTVKLRIDNKHKYIGSFDDINEASNAYVIAKEDNIKRIAEKYKMVVDVRVYNILKNYKI